MVLSRILDRRCGIAAARPSSARRASPRPSRRRHLLRRRPNVNALAPVNPSDFAVLRRIGLRLQYARRVHLHAAAQRWLRLQRPAPRAPEGANLVSGSSGGVPDFSGASTRSPMYTGEVKPLPPTAALSFSTVSCGSDGTMTACVDSQNQAGFVVSPAGSPTSSTRSTRCSPARGHQPLLQLTLRSLSRAPRGRASRRPARGRRPRRSTRG